MKFTFTPLRLLVFIPVFFSSTVSAQNNRIRTGEDIGWYNLFTTVKLSSRLGIHAEYQWRRADFIETWQQSLLRTGLNIQISPRVLARIGYAWIETFPYGEIPINSLGRDFTEHRIYEMLQLLHREGIFDLSHRFMLEQRFVGRYSSSASEREDEFPLLNRMRYLFRFQFPLKGREIADRTPYLAAYDEVLIGLGKNVNANVFDQNRVAVLAGYRNNGKFRLEAGYLNQLIQFGREINNQNIFQSNHGFIINLILLVDASN